MTCDIENMMLDGVSIRCGTCGGSFHTLTREFRPVPPMRGNYLRMKNQFKGNGWYAFPEYDWVVGDNVQCPQCGMPYKMESIIRQVKAYVEKIQSRAVEAGAAVAGAECPAPGAGPVFNQHSNEERGDQGGVPGGGVAGLEDQTGEDFGNPGSDDIGLYDDSFAGDDLISRVVRMSAAGETQARIAETCQISVYMVRQIQNGRKV